MQTISVSELQQNLSLYLEKVKDGDEIIIEETGEVIARILPFDIEDEDAPEISLEEIVKAIRSERDEDYV